MPKKAKGLTARQVETIAEPGAYADGGGLYLFVRSATAKSWVLRYSLAGKRKEMGLGSATKHGLSLAAARALATTHRTVLGQGLDPMVEARKEQKPVPTFGEMADRFVGEMGAAWRNEVHKAQWAMTLREYAGPLRDKPVDAIGTDDVLSVLRPLWIKRPETASRLRGRIERVLNAAKAEGHRSGENPAAWRGHLANLLPARRKLTRGHHAAMPFAEVSAFVAALRTRRATAALALEFAILTAARSGEVIGACWNEIDLEAGIWTVPAERMKAGRPHRVPLVPRALAILEAAKPLARGDAPQPIFPGERRPTLSNMAMAMLMKRMGKGEFTVHGFRSAFRDWAGEETSFPREIAEAALAHVVGDATERAYRRGDALEKRRALMQAWASHLEPPEGNVVPIKRGAS